MRRVYYAFAIRLATHPLLVHGVLLALGVYGLSVMVHVASIMNNIRTIELGNLDNYILNAFMHAEFLTLVFVGVVVFTALSLRFSLKAPRMVTMQTA